MSAHNEPSTNSAPPAAIRADRALAVSVCICTYNRAARLERMLASLAAQDGVDWDAVEVLIIDNNCTDDTATVVARAAKWLRLRRVVEAEQGLSRARNRALVEARAPWILFADDDVVLAPGWLAAFLEAPTRFPPARYLGCRVLPDWGSEGPPHWFRGERLDGLAGVLVWYEMPGRSRMLGPNDPDPFGASFAIHRELADAGERFDPGLGVSGRAIGRGEETEFLRRARARGFVGAYLAEAVCFHPVDRRRLTLSGLFRYGQAAGLTHRRIRATTARGARWRAGLFLVRGIYQLLKGRGDRFRQCVIKAGIQTALARRRYRPYPVDPTKYSN